MASIVGIANRAITKLGEARIISLSDATKQAATIQSMFDAVRDAELRSHVWHFAKARKRLPAMSTAPEFGYAYQFQLPADCLRLLKVGEHRVYPRPTVEGFYSIEGGKILINQPGPLAIQYCRRVEDPNLYDALFCEVLAGRLAVEACEAITQSQTKFDRVAQMYERALRDAIHANAIERPSQAIADDTWLTSRR